MQYGNRKIEAGTTKLFTPKRTAYAALVLAVLFWSGNFVAGRALGGQIEPVWLNTIRWTLCLILFLPFVAPRLYAHRRAALREWPLIAMLGVTGIAGFHTMVYIALTDTTAINALLTLALSPALILIGASMLALRLPTGLQALGSVVSFVGVAVIVTRGQPEVLFQLGFKRGDIWMLGAVVAWSAYSLLLRRRPADLPQDVTLGASIIVALVVLIPSAIFATPASSLDLPPADWLAVLYIAVFASLIAFLLWSHGVSEVGAEASGQFIHLMPVFGAVLAVILLGERVVLPQAIGALLVLTGILLVNRPAGGAGKRFKFRFGPHHGSN